ncbi:MAG: Heavy metal efflux outer membrane protein CzcC family [Labilithrix sp.]|nr:Heavy metal efflux outer membrane protein CzcC family [Labilithrix sp.]
MWNGVVRKEVRRGIAAATASLAALVVLAGASTSHAQPASAPPVDGAPGVLSLSLKDAIDRAEQRAPDVVIAGRLVREAQAQRVGAGVLLPVNPRLSVDARPLITGGPLGQLGTAANLEMVFDLGGAPRARIQEAQRAGEVATADLSLERLRGRIAAWVAYLQVRVAETRIEETKALVGIAERILRASKQRGAMGASGDIEETLATADLGQLRASIESATRQREEHLALLRDVLDLPSSQAIALTTTLDEPPAPPDREALLRKAIESRPELAQIRARLAYLDARYERLGRERFPKIGAYLGLDASPANPMFGILGVSIELPVAQRNQGPRAVTEAARATEMERQDLQARRILREVTSLHAAYESRRAELKVIEGTSVPAAVRTLELVEVGWLAGRFDMFRVATAARDVARIRAARLEALESAWIARIALDRAAGGTTQ